MHPYLTNGLLILTLFVMRAQADLPLRVLSHNIRYATTSPFEGEKPWTDRKASLINELKFNTVYNNEAFICLQEVLNPQLGDILSGLGVDCMLQFHQLRQTH